MEQLEHSMDKKHYNTPRPIPQRTKPSIIRTSLTAKNSLSNLPNLPASSSKNNNKNNNTPMSDIKYIQHHSHHNNTIHSNNTLYSSNHNSNHTSNNTSELQEIVANDFSQISESDDDNDGLGVDDIVSPSNSNSTSNKINNNNNNKNNNNKRIKPKNKEIPHIIDDNRKYLNHNKLKSKSISFNYQSSANTLDAVQGYSRRVSKISNSMSTLNSTHTNSNNNIIDIGYTQTPTASNNISYDYRPKKRRKSAESKYVLNQLIEINDPSKVGKCYGLIINIQHKKMLIKYNNKQFGTEWFDLNDKRISLVEYLFFFFSIK